MSLSQQPKVTTIPRGEMRFSFLLPDGRHEGDALFSPSAELTLAVETEIAELKTFASGVSEVFDSDILETNRTGTVVCNNVTRFIRAKFLIADLGRASQSAGPVTNELASGTAGKDFSYQLGRSVAVGGARNVTGIVSRSNEGADAGIWVTVTDYEVGDFVQTIAGNLHWYMATQAGTADVAEPTFPTDGTTVTDGTVIWQDMGLILYVLGTDYLEDGVLGEVVILNTGAIATAIDLAAASSDANGPVRFSLQFDYTTTDQSFEQITTNSLTPLEGRFTFTTNNLKGNARPQDIYFGEDVLLAPDGDLALLSEDEYQTVSFTISFRKPAVGAAIVVSQKPVA